MPAKSRTTVPDEEALLQQACRRILLALGDGNAVDDPLDVALAELCVAVDGVGPEGPAIRTPAATFRARRRRTREPGIHRTERVTLELPRALVAW
jgi:hypothetical protein